MNAEEFLKEKNLPKRWRGEGEYGEFMYYERSVIQIMNDYHQAKLKLLDIPIVSHSTTPTYLDDTYVVRPIDINTSQVEKNGAVVHIGEEEDCNQWLKDELGYCG